MQRSKQQALMFLLGAVLVGGVLGFSADRLFDHEQRGAWAGRMRMYDDLSLTEAQRVQMDSLLDERNCQINAVMTPVRPQLDSIKSVANQQMMQILTPDQRARLEARRQEMQRRDSTEKARRDSAAAVARGGKTSNACK
jgi:Spy/CpxP family protein refolding chaperone